MVMEATHLRGNLWAVSPVGRLGTCGWVDGKAWTVEYVTAPTAAAALQKAQKAQKA
jgi:hypothetical protein